MTLTALALANEDPGKKQVDNLARGECHDKISKKKRFSKKSPGIHFQDLRMLLSLSHYTYLLSLLLSSLKSHDTTKLMNSNTKSSKFRKKKMFTSPVLLLNNQL